jgi:DNA-binding winged helix-turn-helix (wHTH) protein/Tol biopolymer transport system component
VDPADDTQKGPLVYFDGFTLDLNRRALYRGEQHLHLTPKPLETLIYLVEHRDRLVEKAELLEAVWKDTFVTENTLVHAIREIRRALGDDRADPRFIQTIPRRGYRFSGDISGNQAYGLEQAVAGPQADEPLVTAAAVSSETGKRSSLRSRLAVGGLAVGLLMLLAALWWKPWQRPRGTIQQHLVLSLAGAVRSASFSPDGRMITYVNDVNGVSQIWVQRIDGGDPLQITFGEVPAYRPRWTPFGDRIIFARGRRGSAGGPSFGLETIWSVSAPLGGQPRKMIDNGRNPNWSWDGSVLVFERGDEIWTADQDGGNERQLNGVPPAQYLLADRMPCFSPDGSLITFFQPVSGPSGDFWKIPAVGGQAQRLTFDFCKGGSPVWTPDGRFVVFASDRAWSMTLWRLDASGGQLVALFGGAGEDTDPDISRDGRKLVYTNTRNSYTLTILDPAKKESREIWETRHEIVYPAFSPQGDRISVFSDQS